MERRRRKSFVERIDMREELIKKACELSMKAHKRSKHYLHEETGSSLEALFAFAGSWSVNDWFSGAPFGETEIDLSIFPSLRRIGHRETALVNEAFLRKFKALLDTSSLADEVDKAVEERKKLVFTGHSSGGPLAILTTLWFLEKYTRKDGISSPQCITFGSPLIGDRIFPHAIRRENWANYFINFVMRYDIVPLIMLAPFSSIQPELPRILKFFNPKSKFFKHKSIAKSSEVSTFYMNVLTKASSVASHVACDLMGCTNLLVGNFSSFVELSPYRPFGTYIFCTESRKPAVVVENPDAILQMLFHFSQLSFKEDCSKVVCQKLHENTGYEKVLQHWLEMQDVGYLDSASDDVMETDKALGDLGLCARARLCVRAAEELEKQKLRNEENIDEEFIREVLSTIKEYRKDCELSKVGSYDAFKIEKDEKDFDAEIARLKLAGEWDEIVDMVTNYELPDSFEGKKEWIDLGTEFRQLTEPLDVCNYYKQGRNDDCGPYLIKGRPRRYKFPQRWLDHNKRVLQFELISESSFWGELEELRIISKKTSYEDMKERIIRLEGQVLQWHESKVLQNDVFFDKSIFTVWWNSLPQQHKLESCIRGLFSENITNSET